MDIPDPEAPETWKFFLMTSWRKSDEEAKDKSRVVALADIKAKYKDFAEPFRSANVWVPEGTPVYSNRITYWEPFPWDNHGGRSLAGDPAHPMTFRKPHPSWSCISPISRSSPTIIDRGQGLSHSIADAAKYVAALKTVSCGQAKLKDAMDEYESEMIARGAKEVRLSLMNTDMVHDWDKFIQSPLVQMGTKRNH